MKVSIKLCKHCPLKDDCEYKKNLFSLTRSVLPAITMIHNCPEYKNIFKERDEVEVQLLIPKENDRGDVEWVNDVVARGVVYYTPNGNRQKHYGVAFFESQNFYKSGYETVYDGSECGREVFTPTVEKRDTMGFKANQLKKIGEYTGDAFWEAPNDPTF